jgi:hypothetical protein
MRQSSEYSPTIEDFFVDTLTRGGYQEWQNSRGQ